MHDKKILQDRHRVPEDLKASWWLRKKCPSLSEDHEYSKSEENANACVQVFCFLHASQNGLSGHLYRASNSAIHCLASVALHNILNLVYFMNMSSGDCPISSTILVKVQPRPSQILQCVSCSPLEGSLRSSEPCEISSSETGSPLAGLFLLSV